MWRKAFECVGGETKTTAHIFCKPSDNNQRTKREDQSTENWKKIEKKRRHVETVWVTPNDGASTYGDIVKKMKRNVNVDELGVTIKTIEKAKNGAVKIRIAGGKEEAEKLRQKIETEVGEQAKTEIQKRRRKKVIILDLDEATDKEDLQEAIRKEGIELEDMEIRISRNQRSAVVEMSERVAEHLIKKGRIKVAWMRSRVREVVDPMRCYKCWRYGHIAKDCQIEEEDEVRNQCYKCGEAGHKAKDCKNEARCQKCKEGHREDSMACPKYREMVKARREELNNKKGRLPREEGGGRRTRNRRTAADGPQGSSGQQ